MSVCPCVCIPTVYIVFENYPFTGSANSNIEHSGTRTAKFTLNLLFRLINYEKESFRSQWSDIAHIGQIGKLIFRIYEFGYLHSIQCLDLNTNSISNFLKRPISVYRFLKPTYRTNPDSGLLGI